MKKIDKTAFIYLLGTSLSYGLFIVIQKMGLNAGLEPLSFIFSRSIIIVPISLLLFSSRLKQIKLTKKSDIRNLLIIGIVSAIAILGTVIGQKFTTAINAGFLIRLTPLFVIPFAYLLLKKKYPRESILSMFLILIGTLILTTNAQLIVPQLGDLLIIFAAVAVAFQNVFAKSIMKNVNRDIVILFRLCASGILLIIFIPFLLSGQILDALWNGLNFVIITAFLYLVSVFSQYRAIDLVGPFITTSFFLIGSLFSAFFAYILLGEALTLIQWIGAVGIIVGGYLLAKVGD